MAGYIDTNKAPIGLWASIAAYNARFRAKTDTGQKRLEQAAQALRIRMPQTWGGGFVCESKAYCNTFKALRRKGFIALNTLNGRNLED